MIRLFITLVAAFAAGSAFAAPVTLKLQNANHFPEDHERRRRPHVTDLEFDLALLEGDADANGGDDDSLGGDQGVVNRTIAHGHGGGAAVKSSGKAKSKPPSSAAASTASTSSTSASPTTATSSRWSRPDQALCVGNGFVVESANDVIGSTTPGADRWWARST